MPISTSRFDNDERFELQLRGFIVLSKLFGGGAHVVDDRDLVFVEQTVIAAADGARLAVGSQRAREIAGFTVVLPELEIGLDELR